MQPRFGGWQIDKIDHPSTQKWVNKMAADGLSARTLRWYRPVPKMRLGRATGDGQLLGRNPLARNARLHRQAEPHTYPTAPELAALTLICGDNGEMVSLLAYTGLRFGELTGLNAEDVDATARRIRVGVRAPRSAANSSRAIRDQPPAVALSRFPTRRPGPRAAPGAMTGLDALDDRQVDHR